MTYDIWTVDMTWQLDWCIKRDVSSLEDAEEIAQKAANDRDAVVIVIDDNGSSWEFWPEATT